MTAAEPAPLTPVLSFLPKSIREARRPWRAILLGWLATTIPSLVLAAIVASLFPSLAQPEFKMDPVQALLAIVVISPLIETLIMAAVLSVLLQFVPAVWAILISAAGWAVAHSMIASAWGFVIWWPFLVFSTLYVVWRQRSLKLALAIPATVHALNNLGPTLLIMAGFSK